MKKRQELQDLDGQLTQQLMQSQQKMSEQLRDTINSFLKEYNKHKKYEIIMSNTASDNILIGEGYDITEDVTRMLNARYTNK
jgi:outer membrane protein